MILLKWLIGRDALENLTGWILKTKSQELGKINFHFVYKAPRMESGCSRSPAVSLGLQSILL